MLVEWLLIFNLNGVNHTVEHFAVKWQCEEAGRAIVRKYSEAEFVCVEMKKKDEHQRHP